MACSCADTCRMNLQRADITKFLWWYLHVSFCLSTEGWPGWVDLGACFFRGSVLTVLKYGQLSMSMALTGPDVVRVTTLIETNALRPHSIILASCKPGFRLAWACRKHVASRSKACRKQVESQLQTCLKPSDDRTCATYISDLFFAKWMTKTK